MMFLRRLRPKRTSKHLRMRIESCASTILDLDRFLGKGKIRPEIIEQFERLKESLRYVTDETVGEEDITKIEEATNELLAEIKKLYDDRQFKNLYKGQPH